MNGEYVLSKIEKDLFLIRIVDRRTKYFEGVWYIPEGVVYNSYVLVSSEGVAVFDTVKSVFKEEYFDALKKITDVKDVRYIVTHHMEPDHSGLVKELAEASGATVLGHPLAGRMLRSFYSFGGSFQPVGDGYELKLGEFTVRFIHTPWLHWPETIMSYIPVYRALLTCDAFGSYGVFTKVFYDELGNEEEKLYTRLALKYFANIIGFYRQWVSKNMEKIASTGITPSYLLPSHGVAVRGVYVKEFIETYSKWSKGEPSPGKITVLYTSMYGFVEKAVQRVIGELKRRGVEPRVHFFNDVEHGYFSEILTDVYDSEVLIIATSTYEADVFPPLKQAIDLIARKTPVERKKLIVASLHGWGPRAGSVIKDTLSRQGVKDLVVLEYEVGELERLVEEVLKAV